MPPPPKSSSAALILLCHPTLEALLHCELRARGLLQQAPSSPAGGVGWLAITSPHPLPAPLVFERQRLTNGWCLPLETPPTLSSLQSALPTWAWPSSSAARGKQLVLQVYPFPHNAAHSVQGLSQKWQQALSKGLRNSGWHLLPQGYVHDHWQEIRQPRTNSEDIQVLQVALTAEACLCSWQTAQTLSAPWCGGRPTLRRTKGSAARSVLKLEEAWARLGCAPAVGDHVVDLGAAPGSWSEACLARGAHVLAVDQASLRIRQLDELPGQLQHLQGNGLSFTHRQIRLKGRPTQCWLLCDMLVPPGPVLGLCKRWLSHKSWCSHFVINVKLPQRNPWQAISPLLRWLKGQTPRLHAEARQLYHDRREITIYGSIRR